MDSLKQQAQDYALGTLPKDDAILFEALLEKDEDARMHLIEAQEDFANLSMLAPLSDAGENLRSRVLESCQPKKDFNPFLDSDEINRLRDNYSTPDVRYTGGGGSVDLSDVGESKTQDNLFRAYESLIDLFPLVSGDSAAASGDLGSLGDWIGNGAGNGTLLNSSLEDSLGLSLTQQHGDPVSRSTQRSLLAALPSLTFFINRVREKSATLADVRRIFLPLPGSIENYAGVVRRFGSRSLGRRRKAQGARRRSSSFQVVGCRALLFLRKWKRPLRSLFRRSRYRALR